MNTRLRRILRSLLPAGIRRWLRHTFGWRWFRGDYATWSEARAEARGYDDRANLTRALEAARAVRRGEAVWERDGAVFTEPALRQPLVDALLAVARVRDDLSVVDIGGALGSTWWQHRAAFLGQRVRWRVVEQRTYVTAGQREFSDDVLSFHSRLDEAAVNPPTQVAVLSCVLPYVEDPHAMIAEVIAAGFAHIILDRTPFIAGDRDRLVVQRTPPALGGGSYPCWLFAREGVLRQFASGYERVGEWPGFDDPAPGVEYQGMWFRKKEIR